MAAMVAHPLDSPSPFAAPSTTAGGVQRLLLFCGSRAGADPRHAAMARAVGRLLGERGVDLVYGGGALGLMGETAHAVLAAGGRIEGVIPQFLKDWEVADPLCHDMTVVPTLHERKARMFARADAVLALPGGLGTLDELVEILSWRNLRLHAKPAWLLGDGDFWRPFLQLLAHLADSGFVGRDILDSVELLPDVEALAARLPRP